MGDNMKINIDKLNNITLKPYVCYLLKNITKNKNYIGITQNFEKRKKQHLSINTQKNLSIKKDLINGDNFEMNIIVNNIPNRSEAEDIEYYKIQEYNSINNGYNCVCSTEHLDLDYKTIAKKYGVSPSTISNINKGDLIEFENITYPIRLNNAGKIKTAKILKEIMLYLKNDTYSVQELSKMYKCGSQQIQYINQNISTKLEDDILSISKELGIKSFPINKKYVTTGTINKNYNKNNIAPHN